MINMEEVAEGIYRLEVLIPRKDLSFILRRGNWCEGDSSNMANLAHFLPFIPSFLYSWWESVLMKLVYPDGTVR